MIPFNLPHFFCVTQQINKSIELQLEDLNHYQSSMFICHFDQCCGNSLLIECQKEFKSHSASAQILIRPNCIIFLPCRAQLFFRRIAWHGTRSLRKVSKQVKAAKKGGKLLIGTVDDKLIMKKDFLRNFSFFSSEGAQWFGWKKKVQ